MNKGCPSCGRIIAAENQKCPYCNWETIDVENKSGWFEQHLRKDHNISAEQHLSRFPEDISLYTTKCTAQYIA